MDWVIPPGWRRGDARPIQQAQVQPSGLAEDVVCRIVALKQAHTHWAPRQIQALYARQHSSEEAPSESSIKFVPEKAGLVERRVVRRPSQKGGCLQLRREAQSPSEVWTVDNKG